MESIEEKQEYLRTNILENGYDAEEFLSYLQDKKGEEGVDLNLWSFQELKNVVEEFTLNHGSVEKQEEIKNLEKPIDNNNINNNDYIPQNLNQNVLNKIENNSNESIICKLNEKTQISNINKIKIKLGYPLVVEGGFFSRGYVTYSINTIPFDLKVRKRYSDFVWLRDILCIIYPNMIVPPMPKKNYGSKFNEELISKRLRALERFLNGISIHPLLRNSQIFYDFLSNKEDDFNRKKNEYNKIQSPQYINDYKTINGEANISLSYEKEEYLKKIKEICINYQNDLSNITKAYKNVINTLNILSDEMKNISEIWNNLGKKSEEYLDNQNTIDSFYILSKLMSDWCDVEKKSALILNTEIKEYFRYIKNEFKSLEDLAIKTENNRNIFMKNSENLIYKKNNLFQIGNIHNWELDEQNINDVNLLKDKEIAFTFMLPNETRKVLGEKNLFSFYLNSLIDEYNRIKDLNNIRNRKVVKKFTKDILNNFETFQTNLSEYINQFQLEETKEIEEIEESFE